MNKLETARKLARQTAGQGQYTEKEKQEDPNHKIAEVLVLIMDSQKILNKNQQALATGIQKRLSPLDSWEKRITAMENTVMKLAKQQEKTQKLLMTIFFMGSIPLLAFITVLVLKIWVLK